MNTGSQVSVTLITPHIPCFLFISLVFLFILHVFIVISLYHSHFSFPSYFRFPPVGVPFQYPSYFDSLFSLYYKCQILQTSRMYSLKYSLSSNDFRIACSVARFQCSLSSIFKSTKHDYYTNITAISVSMYFGKHGHKVQMIYCDVSGKC